MPKVKKSRKVGQIGVRSVPKADRVRPAIKTERKKKHRGRPAGSRQQDSDSNTSSPGNRKSAQDPRIGSKKPIDLHAKKAPSRPSTIVNQKKYFSPSEELGAIENDQRLEALLAKLDNDQALTGDDQQYVDQKLARHKVLCDLLGISDEDDEGQPSTEQHRDDDLIATFERNNLDKFR